MRASSPRPVSALFLGLWSQDGSLLLGGLTGSAGIWLGSTTTCISSGPAILTAWRVKSSTVVVHTHAHPAHYWAKHDLADSERPLQCMN